MKLSKLKILKDFRKLLTPTRIFFFREIISKMKAIPADELGTKRYYKILWTDVPEQADQSHFADSRKTIIERNEV